MMNTGIFGRRHLESVLVEFIDHYNQARPHQGIEQQPVRSRNPGRGTGGPGDDAA